MSTSRAIQGVLVLVFGFLFVGFGAASWATCASAPAVNGVAPVCGAFLALLFIGVILVIVGVVLIAIGAMAARRTIYPTTDPAVPPPLIQPVVVQQTVVQETVEVRCRYCQSLNPVTATRCVSCGAAL